MDAVFCRAVSVLGIWCDGLMFGFSSAWLYGAVLAALGAIGAFLRMDARRDAKRDAERADNERANDIRNAVDRDTDKRMSEHDDAGWRD